MAPTDRVRAAFAHAWLGYEQHAFGADELLPVANRSSDNWGGLGITLLDSLDTMLLLGLDGPYERARTWAIEELPERIRRGGAIPFFEITIRALGGLLGAHALRTDAALLGVAARLGHALLPAFTQSPSGIPYCTVHLQSGAASCPQTDLGESIPLAELGSVSLEFATLGAAIHDPQMAHLSDGALRAMRRLPALHGMYPTRIRPAHGGPASKEVGFGAGSDSFYETLLKRWLHGGKSQPSLLRMYRESLTGLRRLLRRSHPSNLLFVARANGGAVGAMPKSLALREANTFEHLTCFLPGMLALGAHHGAGLNSTWEWEVARGLLDTCTALYDRQPSGLGPERVVFVTEHAVGIAASEAAQTERVHLSSTHDYDVVDSHWHLRPEYVESLYVMWRLDGSTSGDHAKGCDSGSSESGGEEPCAVVATTSETRRAEYRERGLRVLDAIERQCRTPSGYASVRFGRSGKAIHGERMESFFLSETLKYLFLLFSEPEHVPIDLERYVLTTEAHALPVISSGAAEHEAASCTDEEGDGAGAEQLPPWWRDEAMLDEAFDISM